jgi:hypothetical protein
MKNRIVTGCPAPLVRVHPPKIHRVQLGFDVRGGPVWQTFAHPIVDAADKWLVYNTYKEYISGTIQHDGAAPDALKMALFLSTSNALTLDSGIDAFADLTNEHAAGSGYTAGGETMTGVTWGDTAGTTTLDSEDVAWTASGGSIVARFAVIYANVTRNGVIGPLICVSLLDNTPLDVTATDGNILSITINASGILTLSGGDVA